jgi:predicted nucleic acid-binding protein
MGNLASNTQPEAKSNEPVIAKAPEEDVSIDWGAVLEWLKAKDYEKAAEHMGREEKYKKSLANMDYGTLLKDRLEYVFRSQILQSIVDSNYSDATVFSILYSEIGGEKAMILEFISKHVEKGLKIAIEEIEGKTQRTSSGLKNYPELIGKFLTHAMSVMQSFTFLEEIYDVQNYLKFLKYLQRPKSKPDLASIQEHCVKYIQEFQATRNFNYYLSWAKTGNVKNASDATNLVNLLSEIAVIVHYVDTYALFLRKQYEVFLPSLILFCFSFFSLEFTS